ncbi:MAG: hypothetical protein ABGW95_01460, partial [Candidatus Poseidoniia archaeon]
MHLSGQGCGRLLNSGEELVVLIGEPIRRDRVRCIGDLRGQSSEPVCRGVVGEERGEALAHADARFRCDALRQHGESRRWRGLDVCTVRRHQSGDATQQCGLAAAVGTDDADPLAVV